MKTIFFILLTVFLVWPGVFIQAEMVAVLNEISNPDMIYVDEQQLYVPEGATIFVYSLKDYKLVKTFGKAGEGPQEFKVQRVGGFPLIIDAQTDNLLITSIGRISTFTKDGQFIKEEKLPPHIRGGMVQPLGKHYFYLSFAQEEKSVYSLVAMSDLNFGNPSEILRVKHFMQPGGKIKPMQQMMSFQTDVKCNHLVVDTADGNLHVFGPDGKKKTVITPELKPRPVTPADKEGILNFFQTDPRLKPMWPRLKDMLEIDTHFRIIQFTNIADCRIYVSTFEMKDGKTLHLIYDKEGKLIKKVFLPVLYRSPIMAFPIAYKNNNFYQLAANDDNETWELHVVSIN